MSLNCLVSQKVKQSLNDTTLNVLDILSSKYNISRELLASAWNKVNKDFKISKIDGVDLEAQTIVENDKVYIIPEIVVDKPIKITFDDEEDNKSVRIIIEEEDEIENDLNLNF
jgi:hypothetical protein